MRVAPAATIALTPSSVRTPPDALMPMSSPDDAPHQRDILGGRAAWTKAG